MLISLTDPTVEPALLANVIVAVLAAYLLIIVFLKLFESLSGFGKRTTITGTVLFSGVMLSIGVTPLGALATELARGFEQIPSAYRTFIKTLLTVETAFSLLFALKKAVDTNEPLAVISYLSALFGGLLLPVQPTIGIGATIVAWLSMELAAVNLW
ncbi:hypothetical protein [Halosimplex halobium]|uniref:hypothetical protein n=1 Tax=Halosimplex halobium TaxID=3396618 RepID=UPI003F57BBF0